VKSLPQINSQTHIHTHARTHAHTHTNTHARTHARAHTRMRTCTHTHARLPTSMSAWTCTSDSPVSMMPSSSCAAWGRHTEPSARASTPAHSSASGQGTRLCTRRGSEWATVWCVYLKGGGALDGGGNSARALLDVCYVRTGVGWLAGSRPTSKLPGTGLAHTQSSLPCQTNTHVHVHARTHKRTHRHTHNTEPCTHAHTHMRRCTFTDTHIQPHKHTHTHTHTSTLSLARPMDSRICALMAGKHASNAAAHPTSASAALILAMAENAAPLRVYDKDCVWMVGVWVD